MAKIDNIDAENRELMDYIFDKKKEIPDEIYVKLADLLKKKEQKKKINKTKLFKMKYVLTEVITPILPVDPDDDGVLEHIQSLSFTNQETREVILRGQRKCTGRSSFQDILHGDIQLCTHGNLGCGWQKGRTLTASDNFIKNYSWSDASQCSRTCVLTILEFGEFDPTK